MLTFAPCFAGIYARAKDTTITESDRALLRQPFASVRGQIDAFGLRTGRVAAVSAVTYARTPVSSTSYWVHPEHRGFAMLDGTLHNRLAVQAMLEKHKLSENASDAEMVYWAFRTWSDDCLKELMGDIVVVVYDEEQGLLCSMDPSGERALFFSSTAQTFRWATHPLLLIDKDAVRCDREFLTNYLAMELRDYTRTPFVGIRRLRPGYRLRVNRDGEIVEGRWWHPPQRGSIRYRERQDYAVQLRELLTEAVRCRMQPHARTGVLLSGGIDSGAVTVCAADLIRTGRLAPEDFTAFTVSSPDNPRSDESPFAAQVAAGIGVHHQRIPAPKRPDMEALTTIAAGIPYPTGHLFIAPWFHEVARVTQQHGTTLLMTGAAGEIFLGDPSCLCTLLTKGQYVQFVKEVAQLWWRGVSTSMLFVPILATLREMSRQSAFGRSDRGVKVDAAVVEFMHSVGDGMSPDPITRDLDQMITQVERSDRWDMAIFRPAGILSKAPFLDRRLLEFAYAIPYELNIPMRKGDVPKPLLREAFPEVPYAVSWQAHRVGLEDLASAQWGTSAQIGILDSMLKNMDHVFDEVLDRRQLEEKLPTIRRPDKLNDIAEALALAIWSNALRSTAVEQFV